MRERNESEMAQCLILGDQKDAGERNRSQKVKTGSQFWVTGDDEFLQKHDEFEIVMRHPNRNER